MQTFFISLIEYTGSITLRDSFVELKEVEIDFKKLYNYSSNVK